VCAAMRLLLIGIGREKLPAPASARHQGRLLLRQIFARDCRLGLKLSLAGHGEENNHSVRAGNPEFELHRGAPLVETDEWCRHSSPSTL